MMARPMELDQLLQSLVTVIQFPTDFWFINNPKIKMKQS